MNAVLDASDRILGNPVLTAHSVVSVERHSRCAEHPVERRGSIACAGLVRSNWLLSGSFQNLFGNILESPEAAIRIERIDYCLWRDGPHNLSGLDVPELKVE